MPTTATGRPPTPRPLREEIPELDGDTWELIDAIKEGLPFDRFEALKKLMGASTEDLRGLLGIPSSTLSRRRRDGRLGRDESERLIRIARMLEHAVRTFGSLEEARAWIREPQYVFGERTPFEVADTEPGAREVERLLGRIEHGITV